MRFIVETYNPGAFQWDRLASLPTMTEALCMAQKLHDEGRDVRILLHEQTYDIETLVELSMDGKWRTY